ncbi:MAG: sugar nucleotide-binding protein [Ignavibacteriales bacterium]|nr:sugar nucleotide-binding protein [Ignavibacteriales bacterium]MCF8305885.1 sugar nucleotide-binding protein [Ignavibacteriales bacterium]MCF8315606.1 sugar nucleotide-binding protein [Ignavibacteriales bacterium]MCF8437200.1 sugar nucleotide-binding protein [Ignavibacteriales bacterium]
MPALKVAITGASGALGGYLLRALSGEYALLAMNRGGSADINRAETAHYDLRDSREMTQILRKFKPDVLVHNAAVSTAAAADSLGLRETYDINVNATANLAALSAEFGFRMIYLSTDLVYGGYRGSFLKEDAKLVPISLYAESKLMGEEAVRKNTDNFLVLRSSLLLSAGYGVEKNYFDYVYRNLKENKPVQCYDDEFRSPLTMTEAARLIKGLILSDQKGLTLNFGGGERVSRLDAAKILCRIFGFDQNLLKPNSLMESAHPYKVQDVSMDISLMKNFGIVPLSLEKMIINEVIV